MLHAPPDCQSFPLKEGILNLWKAKQSADQIACNLGCSRELVFWHLRKARLSGDPRAERRPCQMPAKQRAAKIALLASLDANANYIAKTLGVTKRLVLIRMREMA